MHGGCNEQSSSQSWKIVYDLHLSLGVTAALVVVFLDVKKEVKSKTLPGCLFYEQRFLVAVLVQAVEAAPTGLGSRICSRQLARKKLDASCPLLDDLKLRRKAARQGGVDHRTKPRGHLQASAEVPTLQRMGGSLRNSNAEEC